MRLLGLWLLVSLWSGICFAHRINVFAFFEGQEIRGEVFFSDGKPARKAKIEVKLGEKTYRTQTDEEGRFSLKLPQKPQAEVKIIAYAGLGHRATLTLSPEKTETKDKSSKAKTLPAKPPHLGPSWRDILSGLGYIVGIFGILAYLKARHGAKGRPQDRNNL